MQSKINWCFIISITSILMVNSAGAYDPPKRLNWGLTYEAVATTLEGLPKKERIQIKEAKEREDLPTGFLAAELKKVKLFGKKTKEARVVFDTTGGLCALQYGFVWENKEKTDNVFESANKGRDKSWEYHDELLTALRTKYGDPAATISDELIGHDISSGTKLKTEWVDSVSGDKIILAISRQKKNLVISRLDYYIVVLLYHSPTYTEAKQEEIRESEDI